MRLQYMLDTLADSLKVVMLKSYNGDTIPSFQHFSNVYELQISHYELFKDYPEVVAHKLAGSRFKKSQN